MKIVNLSSSTYKEYANTHSHRNFGQTIEYTNLRFNGSKKKLFLGLIDDDENIYGATLLLVHNVSPYVVEAIAPNGFLIDYEDYELVRVFTEELKKYLRKIRVTYLITNPMFKYKVYDKNNMMIENHESTLNNLYSLEYKSIGYFSQFEKYDVILENNISTNDIYNNFNRNTKRNIKEGLNYGITLHKGKYEDLEEAYNIFKKKTKKKLSFYQNLMKVYNTEENKMEVFFTKLNPHTYLVNVQKLYEEEKRNNDKIHKIFDNSIGNITDKLLNKKINSDNTIEKLKNELNRAIALNQLYNEEITIGTSIVIKNNHEIYFLVDGYKEDYRSIHSTHILKWAIIKKYFTLGYRIFNLGEIHKNYFDKSSKYYGQYMYKIGFGGNVIEYTPNLLLVINKPLYTIHSKLNRKSY